MKKIDYKSKLIACFSVILLAGMVCLAGCGQEEKIGLDPTDGVAPGQPTDIKVENISGGAIISYTPPKDDDLLCVMASYTINGVGMTAKASPYANHLKVEGFGKEGTYEIQLKSVDKSKNESQPIPVTISPTTPPVINIFNTLKITDSFGGMRLTWENETETNIIVEVLQKDGNDWVSKENFYSNAKEGRASIRGLDPELITFGYRIRDRWDNYSEIKEQESLPLLEEQIDKSKFREITALPGDATPHPSLPIRNIWDGNTVSNCFHGTTGDIGKAITFDMGQIAKISRFKMWQRTESAAWIYSHNNLKHYIIYGCNEITTEMRDGGQEVDGEILPTFEGWTEIIDVECYKPSGDSGQVTNEDKEYILNGDEHEVPIEAPAFRYVRIYMLETWSGGSIPQIGEMTFWGQVVK
jgi:hypothetical protein